MTKVESDPLFDEDKGGVLFKIVFNEKYMLRHYKTSYFNQIIRFGSAMSIMLTGWRVLKFLLGIKYKNWLGKYL